VLVVGESLQGMERILAKARSVLLLAGILIPVAITGGVGLLMAPALTAISTLTQLTADVVANENYRKVVTLPARRDEIYQLSATINDLISTVQRTLDQKRQFLAFTSHELRSPLTVILANLDLLRRDLTPEEHMLSVEEAMEEARRMRRLVNDLLLLAEKDSTRVVARTPMRLDSLIEETVAAIVRQDETHNVRVAVEGPVMVEGDAERLMQVVRNLVENALMHTPAGTVVEVRLAQAHGCAHITVADNGPGIAPEHLPYLWDRFYRVDKARSRVKDSTGLGLPIVKYVAEAHGGSVSVSSTPGQGTTFIVSLPLARQAAQANAAAA
jgi:signal transduction histidine kinase